MTRAPDLDAVTLTACGRMRDVEAEKAEIIAVAGGGDAGDRLIVAAGHEEGAGVGSVERGRIVQAGVPAFGRRPVDGKVDLGAGHRADESRSGHDRNIARGPSRSKTAPISS